MVNETVFPGEEVEKNEKQEFTYGKGTSSSGREIGSLLMGVAKKLNRVVVVEPINVFKYEAEVGDVVIGRVADVYNKKWGITCNGRMKSTLSLGSVLLPGVVQRRKGADDEMEMRAIYKIDDLVACEVQKVNRNGTFALHTRSSKYGKLENGMLLKVALSRVRKEKSFFEGNGFRAIVGSNGWIWIETEQYELLRKLKTVIGGSNVPVIDFGAIFGEFC